MKSNQEFKLRHNSVYYNFKLLHELDYVIGGYGQASQEFIFNLNNFVESYVLNEHFLFSSLEWKHHFLIAKATSQNGRPITEIVLTQSNGFQIIGWPHYIKRSKVLYAENAKSSEDMKEESKMMVDFQEKNFEFLNKKYSKPELFDNFKTEYSFLSSSYHNIKDSTDKRYFILETKTTPKELLENLYKTLPNSNFQTSLPLSGVYDQLLSNQKLGISKPTMKILTDLHDIKIDEIIKYTGYKKIPIPPLVPILLSQCKTKDDIPTKLIQLREDFTELRTSFINFERGITKSKTLKEQTKIIEEYKSFWIAFDKKNKVKSSRLMYHFWDLGQKSEVSDSIENIIDGKDDADFLKDLSVVKAVGFIASKTYSFFKERNMLNRYKGITNLWDLLQKSPTLENQARDIERLFNLKIDTTELSKIANKLKKTMPNNI